MMSYIVPFVTGFIFALFVDKTYVHQKIKQSIPLYLYLLIIMSFAFVQSYVSNKIKQIQSYFCKREEPKKFTFPLRKIDFNTNLKVGEGTTS